MSLQVGKFKSRKLYAAIVVFIVASICLYFDKATFDQWSDFIKWVFGLYAAGNVGEHISDKLN